MKGTRKTSNSKHQLNDPQNSDSNNRCHGRQRSQGPLVLLGLHVIHEVRQHTQQTGARPCGPVASDRSRVVPVDEAGDELEQHRVVAGERRIGLEQGDDLLELLQLAQVALRRRLPV